MAKKGGWRTAIDACNKAIELDPKDSWVYVVRAEVYLKKGDFDRAVTDCTEAIRLAGRGGVSSKPGGTDRTFVGLEEAAGLASKTVSKPTTTAAWLTPIGRSLTRRSPTTRKQFESVPIAQETYHERGTVRQQQHEFKRAMADFTEAIQRCGSNAGDAEAAQVYLDRADLYLQLGERARAIGDVSQSTAKRPLLPDAYRRRARLYEQGGEKAKAAADFAQARRLAEPKTAAEAIAQGDWLDSLKNIEGSSDAAIEAYGKAIKSDPKCTAAYLRRGWARVNYQGHHCEGMLCRQKETIADFEAVIRLDPKNARGYEGREDSTGNSKILTP